MDARGAAIRALGLAGGVALERMPRRLLRVLAGPPDIVDGQRLDPEVQLVMRLGLLDDEGAEHRPVEEQRASRRRAAQLVAGRPVRIARTEEIVVPGPAGPLASRLYVPRAAAAGGPLLLYLHGGGWVIGDLDTHDGPCRRLAAGAGLRVLAVEYRLAPEDRFPAALEDSLAALRWAHENAARLGVDRRRIAIGGDSAGGNLAAAASLRAAAGEAPSPALQLLIYPALDLSRRRRSYGLFGDGYELTEGWYAWCVRQYVPDPARRTDPRVSPLLAEDLSGVAPAHVVVAGFDILRDEGEDYARRLREAGVAVTVQRESDLVHAFVNANLATRPKQAFDEMVAALRRRLAQAP